MEKSKAEDLKIINKKGREDLAYVYVAETGEENMVEFVESLSPPLPREEKWVLIISTLYGCPAGCKMCDAGRIYKGKLSKKEMLAQIDYMVLSRYPGRDVPVKKFKIQFARMGEPALNENVLEVLKELPDIYDAPGLMPCVSTIAPKADGFFEDLKNIKERYYNGSFQLQFSIHTTDISRRNELMPLEKWNFNEIANYGEKFHKPGDRKVALNFAMAESYSVNVDLISKIFNPEVFIIKLTPLNPTYNVRQNKLRTVIDPDAPERNEEITEKFRNKGFEVILSIGEQEENKIGSNCGQHIMDIINKE